MKKLETLKDVKSGTLYRYSYINSFGLHENNPRWVFLAEWIGKDAESRWEFNILKIEVETVPWHSEKFNLIDDLDEFNIMEEIGPISENPEYLI